MAATEFGDRTAIVRLRQQLSEAVERAYALAWAIVRLEGKPEGAEAERAARDAMLECAGASRPRCRFQRCKFQSRRRRAASRAAPKAGQRAGDAARHPQGERASVRELQTALEDYGLTISPGNLSVILSRMNQAGLIQRTGRGMYRYAR